MQWSGDPLTENQVKLASLAVVLAIFCLVVFVLNGIHDRVVAQATEISVPHLLFPSGIKQLSPLPTQRLLHVP